MAAAVSITVAIAAIDSAAIRAIAITTNVLFIVWVLVEHLLNIIGKNN
jgi:hypothetical protein